MAVTEAEEQVLAVTSNLNGELTCSPSVGLLTLIWATAGAAASARMSPTRGRETANFIREYLPQDGVRPQVTGGPFLSRASIRVFGG